MARTPTQGRTRARLALEPEDDGFVAPSYFAAGSGRENILWVSSGCALLDECLGGGYALGRCVNIVGDKSAGKTLLAMEAIASFFAVRPEGWARYAESEAAFDDDYARALGIPVEKIERNANNRTIATVEELHEDMVRCLDAHKGKPGIYVIDSLDAISDEAETKRDFSEGSYGGEKPKKIGKMFRLLIDRFHEQDVLLIIVSQLRDKIGVVGFGETKTRSGGRALDFYASQILWLAEDGKIKRTVRQVERVVGIKVQANVKKNKLGLPHRRVEYPIIFGYGIDDMTASVEWLLDIKREAKLEPLGLTKSGYAIRLRALRDRGGQEAKDMRNDLAALVRVEWAAIEQELLPKATKY